MLTMTQPVTRNALSRALLARFQTELDSVRNSSDVRVLVIRSGVEKVFCAGADLKVNPPCSRWLSVSLFEVCVHMCTCIGLKKKKMDKWTTAPSSLRVGGHTQSSPSLMIRHLTQERLSMTPEEVGAFVTSLRSTFSAIEVSGCVQARV